MTYPMSDRTARSRRNRLPLAGKRETSYEALAPQTEVPSQIRELCTLDLVFFRVGAR